MTRLGAWFDSLEGLPPEVPLTAAEKARVAKGELVSKQVNAGKSGFGITVFEVDAPPEVIMKYLLDVGAYQSRVPQIARSRIYKRKKGRLYAEFGMEKFGFKITYFVRHRLPTPNIMIWDLDPTRESDIADTRGFWRIKPHPKKEGRSIIEYAGTIVAPSYAPGFLVSMIMDRALESGSQWVVEYAEHQARLERKALATSR